ncbi:DMT family transporter [Rubellicoccus peritrichatus]|uniref:DMT family transporter n=1 Tax=Rubellicoccus peritrichatus TaxID=3080537 RepID=A0AAQ3QXL4_9BACT|nr:DMT family transporter [Puniceicoccus sp. CR14]WOO42975.1 DMT family transporter [Puniceicoccus sp. CR14]
MLAGATLGVMSGVFMGLLGIISKLGAAYHINAFQVVFAQMSLVTIVMGGYILLRHGLAGFRLQRPGLYLIRTSAGTTYFCAFYLALKGMPITDVLVLESTSPFFALIIMTVMERKRLSPATLGVLTVAFVGVCLILLHHSEKALFNPYALLALLTGLARGIGALSTRALTQVEPIERILFYYPLGTLTFASLTFFWTWPTGSLDQGWPYLLLIGVLFIPLGLSWSMANKFIPSYLAGALFYSSIIVAAIADNTIWDVNFTPKVITGIVLVIAAGAGLTALEALNNRKNHQAG